MEGVATEPEEELVGFAVALGGSHTVAARTAPVVAGPAVEIAAEAGKVEPGSAWE